MKIIKTEHCRTVTEKTIHKTDKGFNIVETVINNEHQNIKFTCDRKDMQVIMLDFPDKWHESYKDYYDINKYIVDVKSVSEVDINKIYFTYSAGHMLFDSNMEIVSLPYIFSYLNSIKQLENDDVVYECLIELLKKHPYVVELEEYVIPYYNSEFTYQKGIKHAKVILPDDIQKRLYKKCIIDEKYWSVRMKNHVALQHTGIYGDEIDELINKYWKLINTTIN